MTIEAGTRLSVAGCLLAAAAYAGPATLTIDVDKPGTKVSPMLYGVFFEEINRAGDGGIYAEMIQNRSFEDDTTPLAWTLVKGEGMALDQAQPLNARNPTSLRLDGPFVIANEGFRGVPRKLDERGDAKRAEASRRRFAEARNGGLSIVEGKTYDLTFYARATNDGGLLIASLKTQTGGMLAEGTMGGLGRTWKKFALSLKADASDAHARLVLATDQPGTLWLDMVSLFPRDTWHGRPNGLRTDLMDMIAALHPAFVRFPGGCFVEGEHIAEAARWKPTIGDVEERPGHWNLWGYRSTDGLGFHEYLQMCEDLGAEPLFVINCGMAHKDSVPMDRMPEFVQDALDAIEYANGPVTSRWGALRAKAGHPNPFGLKYMEIGNENGGPAYHERYALFHDAIKAKYPEIKLIACDWQGLPKNRPLDLIDSHAYTDPVAMRRMATRYDGNDRKGPNVYFGEYAVTRDCGKGNGQAAVAEAAFMTGLERNADVVRMSSYAPLLSNEPWKMWNPNAIVFDQARAYGTPSYWVQAMFAANRADTSLPVALEEAAKSLHAVAGRKGDGVILKVVNSGGQPCETVVNLRGMESISPTGKAIVLTAGNPGDENAFSAPTRIAPREEIVAGLGASFLHAFPANSVTILQVSRKP